LPGQACYANDYGICLKKNKLFTIFGSIYVGRCFNKVDTVTALCFRLRSCLGNANLLWLNA